MPKTIERQGSQSVPYTRMYPQIRGGTCEFCGVIDPKQPAEVQYTLCPHYKDIGEVRCSYCDEMRNPVEVIKQSVVNVHEHPDHPDKLIVVCDDFRCSEKHISRFKVSR